MPVINNNVGPVVSQTVDQTTGKPGGKLPAGVSAAEAANNALAATVDLEGFGSQFRGLGDSGARMDGLPGVFADPLASSVQSGFAGVQYSAAGLTEFGANAQGELPQFPILEFGANAGAAGSEVGQSFHDVAVTRYLDAADTFAVPLQAAQQLQQSPLFQAQAPGGTLLLAMQENVAKSSVAGPGTRKSGQVGSESKANSTAPDPNAGTPDPTAVASGTVQIYNLTGSAPASQLNGFDLSKMPIEDAVAAMFFMLDQDAETDMRGMLSDMQATAKKRQAMNDGLTKLKAAESSLKQEMMKEFNAELAAGKLKSGTTFDQYSAERPVHMPTVTFDYLHGTSTVTSGSLVGGTFGSAKGAGWTIPPDISSGPDKGVGGSGGPGNGVNTHHGAGGTTGTGGDDGTSGVGGTSGTGGTSGSSGSYGVSGAGHEGGASATAVGGAGGAKKSGGKGKVGGGKGVEAGAGAGAVSKSGGAGSVSSVSKADGASSAGGANAGSAGSVDSFSGSEGNANADTLVTATDPTQVPGYDPALDPNATQTVALGDGPISNMDDAISNFSNQKDSLADLSQEQQMKMQMIMDRMQKCAEALSNMEKKFSDTANQIISNFK